MHQYLCRRIEHLAWRRIMGAICVALLLAACGAEDGGPVVAVTDPWVRATVAGQDTTAGYMQLKSQVAAKLVKTTSPSAEAVEVHSMKMEGGVMRMEPVGTLDLRKGETVKLAPGGLHLMLMGVKKPLAQGEKVVLVLSVETADKTVVNVAIQATVRSSADPH
jgi:periplasmic copper chaperone A